MRVISFNGLGFLDNPSGEEYSKSIQRTLVALSRGARAPTNPMKGPAMREFGKDFPRAFEAPDCWIIRQHRHFSRELTLRHSSHDQPHGVRHGTQFPLIPASIRHDGHFCPFAWNGRYVVRKRKKRSVNRCWPMAVLPRESLSAPVRAG